MQNLHDIILKNLVFNTRTGVFIWKKPHKRYGKPVGYVTKPRKNGTPTYFITVNGRRYVGARLAWFYMYKEFPEGCVTILDGDPKALRKSNLKCVPYSASLKNTQKLPDSKVRGIYRNTYSGWTVYHLLPDSKREYVGYTHDLTDAKKLLNNHLLKVKEN